MWADEINKVRKEEINYTANHHPVLSGGTQSPVIQGILTSPAAELTLE